MVLATRHVQRHMLLCGCLFCLGLWQITPPTSCWLVAASFHSQPSIVTHQNELLDIPILTLVKHFSRGIKFVPFPKITFCPGASQSSSASLTFHLRHRKPFAMLETQKPASNWAIIPKQARQDLKPTLHFIIALISCGQIMLSTCRLALSPFTLSLGFQSDETMNLKLKY